MTSDTHLPLRERISRRVRRTETGCLEWLDALSRKNGYAVLWHEGRTQRVSRLVLAATLGRDIRKGLFACHRCDNRKCVDEDHIYEGDNSQNMRDRENRGRGVRGEKNPAAKVTEKQARAIANDPRLQRVVAAEFGISRQLVSDIRLGKKWGSLALGEKAE